MYSFLMTEQVCGKAKNVCTKHGDETVVRGGILSGVISFSLLLRTSRQTTDSFTFHLGRMSKFRLKYFRCSSRALCPLTTQKSQQLPMKVEELWTMKQPTRTAHRTMTMNRLIKLSEPSLLFGYGQSMEDPRDGLTLFGPLDEGKPYGIRPGVIGTKSGRERFARWVEKIRGPVMQTPIQVG